MLELIIAMGSLAALPDGARQEVVCAETGFSRAAETKNQEKFIGFVDLDARFITSGVARGRDEIMAAWAGFFEAGGPVIRWRPMVVEVSADGLLALSRGPYRLTQVDDNGDIHHSWGHFNSTWRRGSDGAWQVIFDAGGDDGMEPTEAEIAALEAEPDCP
jgi:ketosteroid isomerase-like protein